MYATGVLHLGTLTRYDTKIHRPDVTYQIRFNGTVTKQQDEKGVPRFIWEGGETIRAMAYDMPIPGQFASRGNPRWPGARGAFESFVC